MHKGEDIAAGPGQGAAAGNVPQDSAVGAGMPAAIARASAGAEAPPADDGKTAKAEPAPAATAKDRGELGALKPVEASDATDDDDEHADRGEPGDSALLVLEDGPAALDGEVIPPGKHLFDEVNAAHDELMAGMRTTVEKAIALGRALTRAKEKCPHGSWLPWLERYTPIKRRSAAGYMALAAAWSTMRSPERQQLANLGVAGALAELSRRERERRALELEGGRHHRRLEPARKRDPEPAMEPATAPATTEGQVTPEPEQQPEPIPARDCDPAVEPAAEAEPPRGGGKAAQRTPAARNKSSGVDLLSEITSLQRERDEGAIERSRGLASVDRRSARALELLDATIAAQARFLAGLRDLRERVRLEAGGSRP